MQIVRFIGVGLMVALIGSQGALAADEKAEEPQSYEITIKDHVFTPASIEVPANKKVKLVVKNLDSTPEEFESHALKREKVIKGNSEGVVLVGPLKPGQYEFEGEFNSATAKGVIVVK